jgi:hypothetical protein
MRRSMSVDARLKMQEVHKLMSQRQVGRQRARTADLGKVETVNMNGFLMESEVVNRVLAQVLSLAIYLSVRVVKL